MPNHVVNEVIFRNMNALKVSKIRTASLGFQGNVDFSILLPTPLNSWRGSVGSNHTKAFPFTDLDWCAKNWGTKWNAYGKQEDVEENDIFTLRFDTAWGPPYGWLCALLNELGLSFEHNWLSEGESRGHSGVFTFGANTQFGPYEWHEGPCSDEMQKHLHLLRWGVEEFPLEEDDEA